MPAHELEGWKLDARMPDGVAHSWSHPKLAALEGAELTAEIVRPLPSLRERFASVVSWIAYPYGLSSTAVERAAEAGGLAGALLVSGGFGRHGRYSNCCSGCRAGTSLPRSPSTASSCGRLDSCADE